MEVYFVDIGRGTSNLILLGGQRAIIIDCGQNSGSLLHLLAYFRIDTITCLVVSHNHTDHVGGALAVLTEYEGRIEKVCFPQDHILLGSKFADKVNEQIVRKGTLSYAQITRLECSNRPEPLHEEPDGSARLRIFSPHFFDNLQAQAERKPNATSGVLVLDVQGRRVIFAGDSTIRQWRRIRELRGRPVTCDILAVSHHGGIIWDKEAELAWLYSEGVRPDHSIISVSTTNTDKHPRPEVVQALRTCGSTITCTQITRRCCDDLESLRPGLLPPVIPGRARKTPSTTSSGNSKNVACAGTVLAEFRGGNLVLHRMVEHSAAVDRLAASTTGHPLCRA